MGYRINYQKNKSVHSIRALPLTLLCLLLFLLAVENCWPEGASYVHRKLLHVKESAAVVALDQFADDLFRGEQLSEAFSELLTGLQS